MPESEKEALIDHLLWLMEHDLSPIPLGAVGEIPPDYFVERCGGDLEKALQKWPKTPRIKWREYQTRQPTEDEIRSWVNKWPNCNWAVLTGKVIVAVDADSQEADDWVCENLTRTPLRNITGRGRQFIYAVNDSLIIHNSANANAKIDVRGLGGYIVISPSYHPNGTRYEWEMDELYSLKDLGDLPVLSAEDYAKIQAINSTASVPTQAPEGGNLNIDLTATKQTYHGQVVGVGERNTAAASMAGGFLQQGMSLQETVAALMQWNATLPAPLDQVEITTTAASVAQTHLHNNPGAVIPLAPTPAMQALQAPRSDDFGLMSMADMEAMQLEKPTELWGPRILIGGGRMLVAGAPKIGKTFYGMELAVKLACGAAMLGYETTGRPVRVAYFNAEVMAYYARERVENHMVTLTHAQKEMVRANLFMTGRTSIDLLQADSFAMVYDAIEKLQPKVIVIDPVANLHSGDEDKATDMLEVLKRLDVIASTCGAAIVLMHHVRKGGIGKDVDPFDLIRGSGALRGWADTNIILYRAEGLKMTAYEVRNGPSPDPHALWLDESVGEWKIGTKEVDTKAIQQNANADRVNAVLEFMQSPWFQDNYPDGITATILQEWIINSLGVSKSTAERTIKELRDHPRIGSTKRSTERGATRVYFLK